MEPRDAIPAPSQPHPSRHEPRVPLELRVHVTHTGHPEILLFSHDWSRSALFLRTRNPLPPGTPVGLAVVVPGERQPMRFAGTVDRVVTPDQADGDRPPGMAVRVSELPRPLRLHLSALTARARLLNPPPVPSLALPTLLLLGGTGLDVVLLNDDAPPAHLRDHHAEQGMRYLEPAPEELARIESLGVRAATAPIIDKWSGPRELWNKQDTIRHDPARLSEALLGLLKAQRPRLRAIQ